MRPVWKSPTTGVSASIMYLANFSSRASDSLSSPLFILSVSMASAAARRPRMGLTKADIFMRPMCRLYGMASSFSVLIADLLDAGDPAVCESTSPSLCLFPLGVRPERFVRVHVGFQANF